MPPMAPVSLLVPVKSVVAMGAVEAVVSAAGRCFALPGNVTACQIAMAGNVVRMGAEAIAQRAIHGIATSPCPRTPTQVVPQVYFATRQPSFVSIAFPSVTDCSAGMMAAVGFAATVRARVRIAAPRPRNAVQIPSAWFHPLRTVPRWQIALAQIPSRFVQSHASPQPMRSPGRITWTWRTAIRNVVSKIGRQTPRVAPASSCKCNVSTGRRPVAKSWLVWRLVLSGT